MAPDPFVALMRRYVVDYTNSHDLAVCDEIMEPDDASAWARTCWRGATTPTSRPPAASSSSSRDWA